MDEKKALQAFVDAGGDVDKVDMSALQWIVANQPDLLDEGGVEINAPQDASAQAIEELNASNIDALRAGGRMFDYVPGVARAVRHSAYDELAQAFDKDRQDQIDTQEYLKQALDPRTPGTPSSSQYFEKAGLPEMGSVMGVTGRDVLGFGEEVLGDMATSGVINKVAKGTGFLSKARNANTAVDKLTRPMAETQAAGGRRLYEKAFSEADEIAERFGKGSKAVSKTMDKYGVYGTSKSVAKQADNITNTLKNEVDDIVRQADDLGATINLDDAFRDVRERVAKAANDKTLTISQKAEASKLLNQVDEWATTPGTFKPSDVVEIKRNLYKDIKSGAYDTLLGSEKYGQSLSKDLANSAKTAVENSVEQATGRGAELAAKNADMGNLLTAKKTLFKEAKKSANKPWLTQIDAMAAYVDPALFAAKQGGKAVNSTLFKTGVGRALMNDPGIGDTTIRMLLKPKGEQSQ